MRQTGDPERGALNECKRCDGTGKLDWTLAPGALTQFMSDDEREQVERTCPVCGGTGVAVKGNPEARR